MTPKNNPYNDISNVVGICVFVIALIFMFSKC